MTKPFQMPRFFMTAPTPCPYLADREERKIFTQLSGEEPGQLNDLLSEMGFRRSQNIAYRPSCEGCNACMSARVIANRFVPGKADRRTHARNQDIREAVCPPEATLEQYQLMRRYLNGRHHDGGMAEMDAFDYRSMVEDSPVDTCIFEYRLAPPDGEQSGDAGERGKLIGACLTDIVSDGLSMVYSFFDPDEHRRSLGNYMILSHIETARKLELPYIYLGYWIDGCQKMQYKARFQPMEILGEAGWQAMHRTTAPWQEAN